MRLHEHQAKALFEEYEIPVLHHYVVHTAPAAKVAAEKLSTDTVVVKAQIQADGRSSAGGVKLVDTPREAQDYAEMILGENLVTAHTDNNGQRVDSVLVEETCDIDKQLYLSMSIDQVRKQCCLAVSTEGGRDISRVALDTPEKLIKLSLNLSEVVVEECWNKLVGALRLPADLLPQFTTMLKNLHRLIVAKNLVSVEINPLVITHSIKLICLGAKVTIDEATLRQHPELNILTR